MTRRRLTAAALTMLTLAGCIDLSTNPNEIVAIELAPFPFPAIVQGDTLRDSTGVAKSLVASLIDGSGKVVAGDSITFIALDTLVDIKPGGFAIARSLIGTSRIIASGGGLQSVTRNVDVVARPDSLAVDHLPDTLKLGIPDDPATNITGEFRLKLLTKALPATTTRSWVVYYKLRYKGNDIAPGDTSLLFLVNEQGRPSVTDTTDVSGLVSRKVRFKLVPGQVPALDSIIVTAEASYKGALVPGAPARMVVPVKPK